MTGTRLILFEGPPGTGKSTTSERLAKRLANHRQVAFHPAADRAHPIQTRVFEAALSLAGDTPRAAVLEPDDERIFTSPQWAAWTSELVGDGRVGIAEGKFFQHCLEPLFLYGLNEDRIWAEYERMLAAITAARPILVYFAPADLRAHLDRTFAERPEGWGPWLGSLFSLFPWGAEHESRGPALVRSFYERWHSVESKLVEAFDAPTLVVSDPRNDVDQTQRDVEAFVASHLP